MGRNGTRRAIGIDIGGTKVAVGAVDSGGRIVARRELPTESRTGFESAMHRLIDATRGVLSNAGWAPSDIAGLGVGLPGPFDRETGVIHNDYTLPGWGGGNIRATLAEAFGKPVALENDADAALLGEAWMGSARGVRNVVMLTLGTGIGGAALVGGQLYRGAGGTHPELGHLSVEPDGPQCYCGARGCYEAIAAGPAIAREGKAAGFDNSEQVFAAAAAGELAANAIIERALRATEAATWTLIHVLLPERIVFGGGIVDGHWHLIEAAARKSVAAVTLVPPGSIDVARAELGSDAGIVGAASLALSPG